MTAVLSQVPAHGTSRPLVTVDHSGYGTDEIVKHQRNGTLLEFTRDIDQILQPPSPLTEEPWKTSAPGTRGKGRRVSPKQTLMESFGLYFDGPSENSETLGVRRTSVNAGEGHRHEEGAQPQSRLREEAAVKGADGPEIGEDGETSSPPCRTSTELNYPPASLLEESGED